MVNLNHTLNGRIIELTFWIGKVREELQIW